MWTYLLLGVVVVLIACSWPILLWRWDRKVKRSLRSAESTTGTPSRLDPESRVVVHLSDSAVVCERPDGTVERVSWSDLERVEIITTDEGPFSTDVFWVLHGTDSGCVIPGGATGEQELLKRLQALPGFDSREAIEAMGCTSNRRFVCWEKGRSEVIPPETNEAF